MKALILAGGKGSRLPDVTNTRNKSMYHHQGKPLIQYSLDNAQKAGVNEIVIVVGYKAEQIINAFGNVYNGIPVKYVIQWDPKGVVHAIECSKEVIGESDFILFLADEVLVEPKHQEILKYFYSKNLFAVCGVVAVEDKSRIRNTYSIIFDEKSGRIYRLIEKPRNPCNHMMGTGNCVFRNQIYDYIAETPINQKRGEKELPDLIQSAIDDGKPVNIFDVGGGYNNLNTADDLKMLESTAYDCGNS